METTATKTKWLIDNTHSEVQFKVKHLVISTVTGQFNSFEGSLESEDGFNNAEVTFSLDVNSIDTNVADRDAHLKSADFFDAENFKNITFKGRLNATKENLYTLSGDLTIKNTTKNISLNVVYGGQMLDGYGQTKAGFEIEGTINRKEFGLTWNMVTEAGGVVVADNVKLLLNIQLVKQ